MSNKHRRVVKPKALHQAARRRQSKFIFITSLILTAIIVLAYHYYNNYLVQPLMIANIESAYDTPAKCNGACDNGRLLKWRKGRCGDSGKPCNGTAPAPTSTPSTCTSGVNGAFCGGCINRCVLTSELGNQGCAEYVSAKCGSPIVYGASCTQDSVEATKNGWTKYCQECGAWFSRSGTCTGDQGLCAIVKNGACTNGVVDVDTNPKGDAWKCDDKGCRITSNISKTCFVEKYTCNSAKQDQACLDNPSGPTNSQSFDTSTSLCGQVQQIDVVCNGAYRESRTKIMESCQSKDQPPKSPTPSPSPSPSPSPLATCSQVQVYSSKWTLLSSADYASYQAGDKLYLCVTGSSNTGQFIKAEFTVNSITRPEVTFTKPDNNQYFCDLYTIPDNTYSFRFSARIYNTTLGWR